MITIRLDSNQILICFLVTILDLSDFGKSDELEKLGDAAKHIANARVNQYQSSLYRLTELLLLASEIS